MASCDSTDLQDASPARQPPWSTMAWFGCLLALLYMPVLIPMVREWASEESMGHGFFVPIVAGYIAWQRRERVLAAPVRGHWMGWVFVIGAFMQYVAGWFGADFFLMRIAFLMCVLGILVALAGWRVVKELAFPLGLLLFMIRIPLFIYSQITFPLQLLASTLASNVLLLIGIPVLQDGNILELPNQKLSVVEACSGIRSLLSLSFLSLVYGHFFDSRPWMRWVMLVVSVPIAITANAARVAMTGFLSTVNKELAEGVYHSVEGWVLFMIGLGALLLTHRLLCLLLDLKRRRPETGETRDV